jgi:hypothetical protein
MSSTKKPFDGRIALLVTVLFFIAFSETNIGEAAKRDYASARKDRAFSPMRRWIEAKTSFSLDWD